MRLFKLFSGREMLVDDFGKSFEQLIGDFISTMPGFGFIENILSIVSRNQNRVIFYKTEVINLIPNRVHEFHVSNI